MKTVGLRAISLLNANFRNPIDHARSPFRLFLIVLVTCFAVSPKAHGVIPPPDGGYPGFNTAEGDKALFKLTTGTGNTAVGWFSLSSNTQGQFNTGIGAGTLLFNTGDQNTATGAAALLFNTTGELNTANGTAALLNNSTGGNNTATGAGALLSNTSGAGNTATGAGALRVNTTGESNTAIGVRALFINNADNNTAVGHTALLNNTAGDSTAIGYQALVGNTTGFENTAVGSGALAGNMISCCNTAVGWGALRFADGGLNIALGDGAGTNVTDASQVIAIGHNGANVTGTTWISGIYGVNTLSGTVLPVVASNAGQLGTVGSSRRFKKDVKPMDDASEAVLALNPVTFQCKSDTTATPQFGLIAEEVAEVNADLVVREQNGGIYAVRYDAVNAMLLNEFLKEHKTAIEERHKVQNLEAAVADLARTVKVQEMEVRKLKARLQRNASSSETLLNDR